MSNLLELTSPLETERLLLRPFTTGDFDALYAYQSRPDVARYLLWEARTEDEVRAALEKKVSASAIHAEGDFLALAVVLREKGVIVGDFVLKYLSEEHRQGEIGYVIHPAHHGLGYATEAGRVLLRMAFQDLELHRLVGVIDPRNRASARVLEKLGMRLEAHFVENLYLRGGWQSEMVYAILEDEWRAAQMAPPRASSPHDPGALGAAAPLPPDLTKAARAPRARWG
jgi:RimJ/RimL family protein N-acetyltransferase